MGTDEQPISILFFLVNNKYLTERNKEESLHVYVNDKSLEDNMKTYQEVEEKSATKGIPWLFHLIVVD